MIDLKKDYPWVQSPLITVAPMRLITLAKLASAVSNAGGLGFIGGGSDSSELSRELEQAKSLLTVQGKGELLPIGVGFILWAGDELFQNALPVLQKYKPSAVWLFAPEHTRRYKEWTTAIRKISPDMKVWVQIGTVADAKEVVAECQPDVIVVQGFDAGGHGLEKGASVISLLPEVSDAVRGSADTSGPQLVAAGGIMDGRGVAAALTLGAIGVSLGTRYLATTEAKIAPGYQKAVLDATDGGLTTARGKLYDSLRGTTDWPDEYDGRGLLNLSWSDAEKGMTLEDNQRLYKEALKQGDAGFGSQGRLTAYAGTGVGLVSTVADAASVTEKLRKDAISILQASTRQFAA